MGKFNGQDLACTRGDVAQIEGLLRSMEAKPQTLHLVWRPGRGDLTTPLHQTCGRGHFEAFPSQVVGMGPR